MYPQRLVNIVENYFLLDFEKNRFTNKINQVSTQLSELGTFIIDNPNALAVNNQGFISLIQKYKSNRPLVKLFLWYDREFYISCIFGVLCNR
jgi:hypothetical protein